MAVNKNDFRLGNAVLWDSEIWYLQSINSGYAKIQDKDGMILVADFGYEELSPIPLTSKILEQCGFTNKGEIGHNIKQFEIKILNIVPDQYEEGYFGARILFGTTGPFTIAKHIRYLHEVQNIFQSLTGTELNINL